MGDTTIAWTDKVWNPVTGCTKVSQGCKHCYAERVFPRAYSRPDKSGAFRKFTDVRCHPERLDQPLRWRKPCRIFVNSMSDLFHEDIPNAFILKVFDVMRQSANGHAVQLNRLVPTHTFQILTKRAHRMLDFMSRLYFGELGVNLNKEGRPLGPMLKNVWLGVSVEDQATADERIPLLLKTPAAVRFVSYEPALGPVDFSIKECRHEDGYVEPDTNALVCRKCEEGNDLGGIDWIIIGGESGPKARPFLFDWARSTIAQCKAAGVAVFMKQTGTDHAALYERVQKNRAGADPSEWPEDLRIQEFPE